MSAAESPLTARLLGFARMARENGFHVGVEEGMDALAFAAGDSLLDPEALRAGLRSLFCSCDADWRRFDELFDAYWRERGVKLAGPADAGARPGPTGSGPAGPALHQEVGGADEGDAEEGGEGRRGASDREVLGRTDFRHLDDPAALRQAQELAERLARRMRRRLTRRQRLQRRGRRVDLRNTIHRSLRHGGIPFDLAYRKRRRRPVRLVVFLDASGSMSLYSSVFMRFVRGIVASFAEAEAFVFHTRLVHVSAVLHERDLDKALDRMNLLSAGWGGGTRLGDSLRAFNDAYAEKVLNSRSVVLILSDGYDTGDPQELARQLERLSKRTRRIAWLNPLLGWEGYEPVARGMAAAMPYLDLFAPAHNLESLAALEPYLCRL